MNWSHYYDQLLKTFNIVYDSYSNVSLILLGRFHYLQRHFPDGLNFYEANIYLVLLELYRGEVITKKELAEYKDIEKSAFVRLSILKAIEKSFDIFIYQHDLEMMAKNPKAFSSFLLALSGQRYFMDKNIKVDDWGCAEAAKFIVPHFLKG